MMRMGREGRLASQACGCRRDRRGGSAGRGIWVPPLLAVLLGFILISSDRSYAISPFARKYDTSCNTCHIAYPKLNAFGEAFRLNGYRFPGKDRSYIKEEPLRLGAPAYKRVWPDAVWPGTIPATPPVGFLASGRFLYEDREDVKTTFNFPRAFEILTGGTFGESISFFGGASLFEEGEEGDVEVERLFIQFDDLLSKWLPERALNVKIGFYELAAVPFSGRRRLSLSPYLLNDFSVPADGFRLGDSQAGIELHGLTGGRFRYALGLVNGTGEAGDDNSEKDLYFRLQLKLGGMRLDGVIPEEGEGTVSDGTYEDNSISLGAFGYVGRSTFAMGSGGEYDDDFDRVGFDARLIYNRVDLFGAYMKGRDEDPAGIGQELDSTAWFVESDVTLYPWLFMLLRYGEVEVDGRPSLRRFVPGLVILARANLRFTLEGEIFTDSAADNRLAVEVGFVY